MNEEQAAISFKLPRELKDQVDALIAKHDLTLTGLVLEYFRRRLQAERDAGQRGTVLGQRPVELTLLLGEELAAAVYAEAGRQQLSVDEFVYRLLGKAVGTGGPRTSLPAVPDAYADFPKLVDCVRQAYREDHSPIDALLALYPSLAPSSIPMGQLFAAAIAAVSVDQVISERVAEALRTLRERKAKKV
ncbi:MAG: hypothetical protein ACYC3I_17515 [Gemmataceae bacterium]